MGSTRDEFTRPGYEVLQHPFKKKTLSHFSTHLVNHLLRENQKTIPKFLSGKKLFFKNVTIQILNFIPLSLLIKFSPYGIMKYFLCFFILFNGVKTDTKLTLHLMSKTFII